MEEHPHREFLENLARSIRIGRGMAMDQISALRGEVTSEVTPMREDLRRLWNLSGSSIVRSLVLTSVMELNLCTTLSASIWADTKEPKALEVLQDCVRASHEIEAKLGTIPVDTDFTAKLDIGETCVRIVDEVCNRAAEMFGNLKPP